MGGLNVSLVPFSLIAREKIRPKKGRTVRASFMKTSVKLYRKKFFILNIGFE